MVAIATAVSHSLVMGTKDAISLSGRCYYLFLLMQLHISASNCALGDDVAANANLMLMLLLNRTLLLLMLLLISAAKATITAAGAVTPPCC